MAVRISPDHRPGIVGSPAYFRLARQPNLLGHRCINFRHRGEGVYRWELDKWEQSVAVAVSGPLILDDVDLMIQAAMDGAGLAFMAEGRAAPHLASGTLERVLEDRSPPFRVTAFSRNLTRTGRCGNAGAHAKRCAQKLVTLCGLPGIPFPRRAPPSRWLRPRSGH